MYEGNAARSVSLVSDPPDNPVTAARNRVSLIATDVMKIRSVVGEIANTMFGVGAPSSAVGVAPGNMPSRAGESGLLHDEIDALSRAMDGLWEQVNRLESLRADTPRIAQSNGTR